MSNEVRAAEGALAKGAQVVRDTHQDLNGKFAALRGDVESIGSQWEGGSNTAFLTLMASWDAQAKRVTDALTGLADNLDRTQQGFTARDEEAQATMNKFSSMIGQ